MGEKGFVAIIPILVIICLLCAVGGFFLGRYSVLNTLHATPKTNSSVQIAPTNTVPKSIVTSQSLTIQGTITQVSKNTVTIKDPQGQNSTTLALPSSFMLLTIPVKGGAPSPEPITDSSKIPTGVQAAITAVYGTNQEYEVTTIAIVKQSSATASPQPTSKAGK